MRSVCSNLSSENFPRVRVGIGQPMYKINLINYVIGKVDEETLKILDKATDTAKDAVIDIIKNGIDKAMNKYN